MLEPLPEDCWISYSVQSDDTAHLSLCVEIPWRFSTIPIGVSPYRLMILSLRDPWLVPMRMAVPYSLHYFD